MSRLSLVNNENLIQGQGSKEKENLNPMNLDPTTLRPYYHSISMTL